MAPVGLTANQLALSLRIPANRITAIIAGKRVGSAPLCSHE
jgi:plasmid maintenance system antidote protein VapI